MPEKQTFSTTHHLEQMSSRKGDDIRNGVEDRFRTLHTSRSENGHEAVFENIEQPEAERILGDIAELAKYAHGEVGNNTDTEVVWKRAMEIATEKLYAAIEDNDEKTAIDGALNLVVMDLLDTATREKAKGEQDVLDLLLERPPSKVKYVLSDAANLADHLGLVVNANIEEGVWKLFPVAEEIRGALDAHDRKKDEAHEEAKRIEFGRRSPEENDANLLKIMNHLDKVFANEIALGYTMLDYRYDQELTMTSINDIIKSDNYTNEGFGDFLVKLREQTDILNRALKERNQIPMGYDFIVSKIFNKLPTTRLRSLYNESGGVVHDVLLVQASDLENDFKRKDRMHHVTVAMSKIYNLNAVQLSIQVGEEHPIIGELMQYGDFRKELLQSVLDLEKPTAPESYASEAEYIRAAQIYDNNVETWLRDCLDIIVDLPSSLNSEIRASIYGWTRRQEGPYRLPSTSSIANVVWQIDALNTYLGAHTFNRDFIDGLDTLREKTGIVNAFNYTPNQLARMIDLVNHDEATINHLREGDVTVVFSDARGDHNGALKKVPDSYEKPSGRTLFFEINQPSDFYRYSLLLKNLGIADSTRVIAAHGGAQGMHFGSSSYFSLGPTDRSKDWLQNIKLGYIPGIRRIADEFMQDSRGIDDPENLIGRRRLILNSCSQGVDYIPSDDGEPTSSGAVFTKNIGKENVDVYAASENISLRRNDNDLKFTATETMEPSKIRRFTLEPSSLSTVKTTEVEKIELYQKA